MKSIKPKGQNEITDYARKRFRKVYQDLKSLGTSETCPFFYRLRQAGGTCHICDQAFPKNPGVCPCHSGYSKKYLLKRVREIIQTGMI